MGDLTLSWISCVHCGNAEGSAKHGVTMQKNAYTTKFYFNFVLTEATFENNEALNINGICLYNLRFS